MKTGTFSCFVHIEKAGGITLHNLFHHLSTNYISPSPEHKFGEFLKSSDLKKIKKFYPTKIQGIGGHKVGTFLNYEDVIDQNIIYFTFMRDPIKRYISHLNWQKNIMNIDWTIEAFIDDSHFNNYQAYRIAGQRDLEMAWEQIKSKFSFIGLLERYDESLIMLSKYINIPFEKMTYERSNIKNYSSSFKFEEQPKKIQDKIIANNQIDIELYHRVEQKLFKKEIEEYKEENLQQDLKIFKSLNDSFKFPLKTLLKRKTSNLYLKKIVQPFIRE